MEDAYPLAALPVLLPAAAVCAVLVPAFVFTLSNRFSATNKRLLIAFFAAGLLGTLLVAQRLLPEGALLLLALLLFIALLGACLVAPLIVKRTSGDLDQSFYSLVEELTDGLRIVKEGVTIYANRRFCEMTGYPLHELLGRPDNIIFEPDSLPVVEEQQKLRRAGKKSSYEVKLRRKDGATIPAIVAAQPLYDGAGKWIGSCGVFTDITHRISAELQLRESERRFKDFAETASDRFWEMDADLRFTFVSGAEPGNSKPEPGYVLGRTRWEKAGGDPESDELWQKHRNDLLERNAFRGFRYSERDRHGRMRHWKVSGKPIYDSSGTFIGYRGTSQEVTKEVEAQQQAAAAQRQLINALDTIGEGFAFFDADDRLVLCNRRCKEIFPEVADMLVPGSSFSDIYRAAMERGMIEDDTNDIESRVRERIAARRDGSRPAIRRLSGNRWVQITERPTVDGGVVAVWSDITELKRGEEQLLHAQKMEAVGQLTGGIAHDFNNMLAVILGSLELLQDKLESGTPLQRLAARALTATRRGAALTQRLLAFSRKHPLQPKATDVGGLIRGMKEILETSLGEAIEIRLHFPEQLPPALVDPVQLETTLLNLALNSRDAMPQGGVLEIAARYRVVAEETTLSLSGERLPPGGYLSISVTDNGCGMAREVKERIFEPFFTTKEIGKGSGLGLSMVYGFVQQSAGHIAVESEPGRGTSIELLLPEAATEAALSEKTPGQPLDCIAQGERVLVVEDDAGVRDLIVSILLDLGYAVDQAPDAPSALLSLALGPKTDLLLSDVVLPAGMSGVELAEEATRRYPRMRVLLMSGYMEHLSLAGLSEEPLLLRKPFRRADLARKIREALGSNRQLLPIEKESSRHTIAEHPEPKPAAADTAPRTTHWR